ncbi:urea ABC transporter permease subunit UrtB [Novispirillum sp. DQ9]|uniref:urea ABC transporter permease subunit UrtB n=1 Tax=Novispirillum sp. DQ9 TaxID=3398612 RepID=UPI003C7D5998
MSRILAALCLVLALIFAAAPPARADDAAFAAAVAGLDQTSFPKRAEAVDTLGALGHPRTETVLRALAAGELFARKDDRRVVIGRRSGDGFELTDAATGEAAGHAASGDLAKIIANNQMRGQIEGILGAFLLFSADAGDRLRAADQILASPEAAAAAPLRKALDTETDATVRARLERALAAALLSGGGSVEERRAAVATLGNTNDTTLRALIQRTVADDPDDSVRAAATAALAAIDKRLAFLDIGQNMVFGLSLGSVLLLAAIGLAITFGVMGVINMAHGEMIMLGAYTTFVVQEAFRSHLSPDLFGLYLVVAIPAAFVVAGAVGVAMERSVIRFLYGRPLETLLATWGISLALQQAVRSLFGATNREVANPAWMSGSLDFLGLSLTTNRIVIILFALAVVIGLAAFLRWSAMGLNMRAVTQNRRMAAAMGIPTGRVDALTFGLGSGIAGVAGVALSQVSNVSPNLGQGYIVDSFMVVVFGGVGSLWGTVVGAFSLGIVNKFLEPYSGAVLAKILVLVLIILFIQKRPRGLFALRGRFVE